MNATLYFDGICTLCIREINLLTRLKNSELNLIDIHSLSDQELPKPKQTLLEVLHLQTNDGQWYLGLNASIKAWQYTPYGFLFRPLGWPLIRVWSNALYRYWSKRRYCRLYPAQTKPLT